MKRKPRYFRYISLISSPIYRPHSPSMVLLGKPTMKRGESYEAETFLSPARSPLFAVMAVSFAVVICLLHRQPGTLYREVFLHTHTDGDTTVYSGRRSGRAVVIRRTEQSGQTVVTFSVEGVFSQICTVPRCLVSSSRQTEGNFPASRRRSVIPSCSAGSGSSFRSSSSASGI